MREVRTRFAPSPTGYLHIGGVRTALFNWLYARHHGGKFILRIEDTDKSRSTPGSINAILEGLEWLGLDWDEGPYLQSQRITLYQEHVERLLKEGKAYPCYCSPEELEVKRIQALKEGRKPKYDGRCRQLKERPISNSPAIRFKTPPEGKTIVEDGIKGRVEFQNPELDDLIILRRNGAPTYNFTVMVDDATMGITHVIRGDDHLNNTPRQILLYEAFGYPLPFFAHLPMILGVDKTRLSKRQGAVSILSYRDMGYLPQTMINYLVRLGWSYGDQEIFSIEELIEKFTLDKVGKAAAVFNPQKLLWLNSHYLQKETPKSLAKLLVPFIEEEMGYKVKEEELCKLVALLRGRSKTLRELVDNALFYFEEEIVYEEEASRSFLTPEMKEILKILISELENLRKLGSKEVEEVFHKITLKENISLVKLAQAVRVALTGRRVSPGIFEVIEILDKEKVLSRLSKAREYIS